MEHCIATAEIELRGPVATASHAMTLLHAIIITLHCIAVA